MVLRLSPEAAAAHNARINVNVQTKPEKPVARHRFRIGIDPGKKTGFAVWNQIERKFDKIKTVDFWQLVREVEQYSKGEVLIIVELPNVSKVWADSKSGCPMSSARTAQKVAVNVGGVIREAELICDGLRRAGYTVKEAHPQGKLTNKGFRLMTGHTGRTNEHSRDAGSIAFMGGAKFNAKQWNDLANSRVAA